LISVKVDVKKNIFFLGKGGTGKTTIAALTALALVEKGAKVALISMDPAHNLFDVFQIKSKKHSTIFDKHLVIEEIDIEYWIKTYLRSIEQQVSKSYQYLTSLSLEKHLQVIRYSPGLEEYALIFAYESLQKKYDQFSYRIFDMPPTALAMRFFNLPQLTLVWMEKLIQIRKIILSKKKIIENIHSIPNKSDPDKILNQLKILQEDYKRINSRFCDEDETAINVVINEDKLSISESGDIERHFNSLGLEINKMIVNKSRDEIKENKFEKLFKAKSFSFLPYTPNPLIGIAALKNYIEDAHFQKYKAKIL
jgi:arsenite-transporting ATPase